MGRINIDLLRRTSAQTALPVASISRADATAPGRALVRVGGQVQRLARAGERLLEQKNDAQASANVASFDYNLRLFELQGKTEPGAEGFTQTVLEDYPQAVEEHIASIEDPSARRAARTKLLARQPAVNSAAAKFQIESTISVARQDADTALETVENRLRADPLIYEEAVADASSVIMSMPGIDATTKRGMVRVAGEDLAAARFEAMISAAQTDGQFDAIERELRTDVWQARFNPRDYDRALDSIAIARNGVNTQLAAAGRAAVTSLEERSTAGVIVPVEELANAEAVVAASGDAALVWRVAELHAEQNAYIDAQTMTLRGIDATERKLRGESQFSGAGVSPEVVRAIDQAAQVSGIPASTLSAVSMFEAGGGTPGATLAVDAKGKPITTAFGPFQITEGTFSNIITMFPDQFPEAAGLKGAELQALRGDPAVAARATAFLAVANTMELRRRLGREPGPADLVLAHFLGGREAARFIIAMESTPSAIASELFEVAAKNNRSIFFFSKDEGGAARTLRQVRAEITDRSVSAPGRIQFARAEAFRKAGDNMARRLRDDPATLADSSGFAALQPLEDSAAFSVRGQQMRSFFTKHRMLPDEWKPLTASEARELGAKMAVASVDDQLQMIEDLQGLGPDMTEASLRQLDLSAPLFAFAGGLSVAGGDKESATLVLRGAKRMQENPSQFSVKALGGEDLFSGVFTQHLAQAGVGLEPDQQEAIFNAAIAHYVETQGVSGRGFNLSAFKNSISAVTGGPTERVNGLATLTPKGTNGGEVEVFLGGMTQSDMIMFSVDTLPPRFADGEEVTLDEMADAQLVAIGGGIYRVLIDGQNVITRVSPENFGSNYLLRLDSAEIQKRAALAQAERDRAGEFVPAEFGDISP